MRTVAGSNSPRISFGAAASPLWLDLAGAGVGSIPIWDQSRLPTRLTVFVGPQATFEARLHLCRWLRREEEE